MLLAQCHAKGDFKWHLLSFFHLFHQIECLTEIDQGNFCKVTTPFCVCNNISNYSAILNFFRKGKSVIGVSRKLATNFLQEKATRFTVKKIFKLDLLILHVCWLSDITDREHICN